MLSQSDQLLKDLTAQLKALTMAIQPRESHISAAPASSPPARPPPPSKASSKPPRDKLDVQSPFEGTRLAIYGVKLQGSLQPPRRCSQLAPLQPPSTTRSLLSCSGAKQSRCPAAPQRRLCPVAAAAAAPHLKPGRPSSLPDLCQTSATRPWSHISLDFVTGLPPSEGSTAILIVVDQFSKAAHFIPARGALLSAEETARLVIEHVFRLHGIPHAVLLHRGSQFASGFWKAFGSLLGMSLGVHPQSNGPTEACVNQDLETILRCCVSSNPSSWSDHLTWLEYAHNSLRLSATGLSPFEIQYGYQPLAFPGEQGSTVGVPDAPEMFFRGCKQAWRKAHAAMCGSGSSPKARRTTALHGTARPALLHSSSQGQAQTQHHHRPTTTYQAGQRVFVSTSEFPLQVAPQSLGPFRVLRRVNRVTYRLLLPRSWRIRPVFHVSRLKPLQGPAACPMMAAMSPATTKPAPPPPPPPHRVVGGRPAYPVERILRSRRRRRTQYLVVWGRRRGGPQRRYSWVPTWAILDPGLIREFHKGF